MFAHRELGNFTPKSASWENLRLYIVDRINLFQAEQNAVPARVRAGTAFDAATVQDPMQRAAQYKAEVLAHAKTLPK
jgi:hypothetical protein